jgi:hypothetical protein
MAERQFSETERAELARKGQALPDGSFPMPDCDAVKRVHESYGRAPESHKAEVRALANKRNRELGCGLPELED